MVDLTLPLSVTVKTNIDGMTDHLVKELCFSGLKGTSNLVRLPTSPL